MAKAKLLCFCSTIKCGCRWPVHPCLLCTGRTDPTAPRDLPDMLSTQESVALLDPCYHPILSFPEGKCRCCRRRHRLGLFKFSWILLRSFQMCHKIFTWRQRYVSPNGKIVWPVHQRRRSSKVHWQCKRQTNVMNNGLLQRPPLPSQPQQTRALLRVNIQMQHMQRLTRRKCHRKNSNWLRTVSWIGWNCAMHIQSRAKIKLSIVNLSFVELKKTQNNTTNNNRKIKKSTLHTSKVTKKNKPRKNSHMSATSSDHHDMDIGSPNGSISRSKNPSPIPGHSYRYER